MNYLAHRILHVITGLNDGGAEAVLYRLCTYDSSSRVHHVVSLVDMGKYGPLLAAKGIRVTCLNMPRGRVTLHGILHLWNILRKENPDLIQTWMYHSDLLGGTLAFLAGHRNIIWGIHHTSLNPNENSRGTIMVARICALISRIIPKKIICCAESARDAHIAFGYSSSRMHVIPNGYDLSTFCPAPSSRARVRNELGLRSDDPVIGFVARFDPLKDHATLLAALSQMDPCPTCLLVGAGMDESNSELMELAKSLNVSGKIRLLGKRNDIPSIMNALDIHVMSSSGEAFPNVLAEAMACMTPCISTDVGDARNIVGNTGWIVPVRSPESLAHAIIQAPSEKRSTQQWIQRQRSARHRIESLFSISKMVEDYHAAWSSSTAN